MTTQASAHRSEIAGVWASTPERLPFAPDTVIRTFLLERARGNLLIYNTGGLEDDLSAVEARGGAARQYLNHRHEALFGSPAPARRLGARILVHAADASSIARREWRPHLRFSRRHTLDDDFEVIPIPGHTKGATAYLWDNGRERLLFTGDSVMLSDGEWVAAVLDSSDRESYITSLDRLASLEFDVLVPWAADADGPWYARVAAGEARGRIEAIAARLRSGGDR